MNYLNELKIIVTNLHSKWNFHKNLINKEGKIEDTFACCNQCQKIIKRVEKSHKSNSYHHMRYNIFWKNFNF